LDLGRWKTASVFGGALWLSLAVAQAATFTVTTLNDSGPGSLRQALLDAETQPGADRIEFEEGLNGLLPILGTLTISGVIDIVGPGADVLTILGNGSGRDVFSVSDGAEVDISGLGITNGADGIENGGTLTVSNCAIYQNFGIGIHNWGNLTVNDSRIDENNGDGIYNSWCCDAVLAVNRSVIVDNAETGVENNNGGTVTIFESVLSGNRNRGFYSYRGSFIIDQSTLIGNSTTENNGGGALHSNSATTLSITNSTISGNEALSGCGGGITISNSSTITFHNNTLSGNSAKTGGGLCVGSSTLLNLFNTTISDNFATSKGGGIYLWDTTSTLLMGNSLVAGNAATVNNTDPNAGIELYSNGTFSSRGGNLFGQNGTLGLVNATAGATDLTLAGPISTAIGTLANNGGPTQTHIAAADSPILDAGNNSLVPNDATTDQRGEERIQNNTVEIGAVEGTNPRDDLDWRVTEIYIATLGWAPDNEGLQYWVNQMTIDPKWTPTTVAQSFFDQPGVQALYPVGDDGALIDALYQNLFAREADTLGRNYWLAELAAARVERNQMIIALIEGGYANHEAIDDMARFTNQVQIGRAFSAEQERLGIVYRSLNTEQQATLLDIGADLMDQATSEAGMRDRLISQIPGLLAGLAP
jgi:hypothetical protein